MLFGAERVENLKKMKIMRIVIDFITEVNFTNVNMGKEISIIYSNGVYTGNLCHLSAYNKIF